MGKAKKNKSKSRAASASAQGILSKDSVKDLSDPFEHFSLEELIEKGEELLEEFEFKEAHGYLSAAARRSPDNGKVLFTLGVCLIELNNPGEAKQVVERSCELEPEADLNRWLVLAELEHGRDSLNCLQNAARLAEQQLEAPIEDDVEDEEYELKRRKRELSKIYVCISELYSSDLCDEDVAEQMVTSSIEKAIEIDSENPEAIQALANYHLIVGNVEVAEEKVRESIALWMPAFVKQIEEGIAADPLDVPPFNVRLATAKICIELTLYSEARDVIDGLLAEDEISFDCMYLLAWINYLEGNKRYSTAKYYLKEAQKIAKQYGCEDEAMLEHVVELLEELKDVETDDEEECDEEADDEEWETDDETMQ